MVRVQVMYLHVRNLLHLMLVFSLVGPLGLAGCLDDDADEAGADDLEAGVLDGYIQTDASTGLLTATVATPIRTLNQGGEYNFPFTVADNTTGLVFELEWDSVDTSTGSLSMWIEEADAGAINEANLVDRPEPILKVSGGSPLRATLAFEDFPAPGAYEVLIRAAEPIGAAYEQPFSYYVTTFTEVDFDPEFTALAQE